jgi:RNA polymerase sigma-70 factor (ECF subfamily)
MNDPGIEEALRQVKDGRAEAYATVVSAFQARLRATVAYSCPPGIDPTEIAHRAFVEAFRQIDRYTPGTRFFAWVATIARTLLLLELRKRKRDERGRDGYVRHVVERTLEAELEGRSDLEEARGEALQDCVRHLPPELQSILRLRYSKDASISSIAGEVGKSPGAVKFLLFDLRRRLRDCVNGKLALRET